MIRLIIGVVILVLLAVLIALNIGESHAAALNLFGYQVERISVIAVGIGGFVLGILYSLLVYLLRSIDRFRKSKLRGRVRELEERTKVQEESLKQAVKTAEERPTVGAPEAGSAKKRGARGGRSSR